MTHDPAQIAHLNIELPDVIDVPALQDMMDDFYELIGVTSAVLDMKGKVLISCGWQDICVKFHRAVPESCEFCHESDIILSNGVAPGTFKAYRCKNNLWDMVTPIMLGDIHIGNLFMGQMLYDDEEPDYELFRAQAARYGYDETAYLAALDRVPRFSRKTVHTAMNFCSKLAENISRISYSNNLLKDTVAERERLQDELQQQVEELRESNSYLDNLFTYANIPIIVWDTRLNITRFNRVFETLSGRSADEVIGKNISILFPPDKVDASMTLIRSTSGGARWETVEIPIIHVNGAVSTLLWNSATVYQEDGVTPLATIAQGYDITERKQIEEDLRNFNSYNRTLIEANPEPLVTINPDGKISDVNLATELMTGYLRHELIGTDFSDYFTDPGKARDGYRQVFNKGFVRDYPLEIRHRNGHTTAVLYNAAVYQDDSGNMLGVFASARDVTELKKAETEIRQINAELELRVLERTSQLKAANQEMESFAYSVSHDLRAPLRSIDGFCLALLEDYDEKLDEQGKDYLRRVRTATQRMAQLIDDILNLSRTTRSELTTEAVNLSAMAAAIAEDLRRENPERQVKFIIKKGVKVKGDPRLLRVVMDNLLGNAWKFSSGHAAARIEFGTIDIKGKNTCFIRDDGAGFDMNYVDKLFVTFQRLHSEQEFPGTGVGLALVQHIIHRHGGTVWADGAVEQGATFYFTLE